MITKSRIHVQLVSAAVIAVTATTSAWGQSLDVSQAYYAGNPQIGTGVSPVSFSTSGCAGQKPCSGCAECSAYADCTVAPAIAYSAGPCHDSWNVWGNYQMLLWWTQGRKTPPLATTSPPNTPRLDPDTSTLPWAGTLGRDSTAVLFGGDEVGSGVQMGGRVDFGKWIDNCQTKGIGGTFMILDGDDKGFWASSPDGARTLARPFINLLLGPTLPAGTSLEDANMISYTDPTVGPLRAGGIGVESDLDIMAADGYMRFMIHRGCGLRMDLLGGYHFGRLDDTLRINTVSQVLTNTEGPFRPLGAVIQEVDLFATQNEFHGGMLALMSEFYYRRWTLSALSKLSLGNMNERVRIAGGTTITPRNAASSTADTGFLTQNTNIGEYERNRFALIPELSVDLAYQLNPCWSLSLGYSIVYWNRVVMAGQQVNRVLDLSQVGGFPPAIADQPEFLFVGSDFWAQGFNFGVECLY